MNFLSTVASLVKQAALETGFDLAGIAGVRDFPELDYFSEWIASGYAGDMKYMENRDETGELKRASLARVVPWARSVIVCAINYNTEQPYSTRVNDPDRGWISRYAWTREDYHDTVMRRLRALESRFRELVAVYSPPTNSIRGNPYKFVVETSHPPFVTREHPRESEASFEVGLGVTDGYTCDLQTRCYVDTGPLVERVYAKYAGVGWIGKNTCIINQKLGSWLFLGVILTSLELTPDVPAPDRCGTCTRCIDACPTDALLEPYKLDSIRCISYLTIEKRGVIAEELRAGMGRQVYGCDICQDVCPWNRKAPVTHAEELQPRPGLVNPALEWLAQMQSEEFRQIFRGSPVKRTKLSGLRRNAVIAMGNSGNQEFVSLLQKLTGDEDPNVAGAARWALSKLGAHPQERHRS